LGKLYHLAGLTVVAALLAAATPSHGALRKTYELTGDPDTTAASNTAIDIVAHAGGIWLGTPAGLNFSLDSGKTWLLYRKGNGLRQDDVSALFSSGDRLWVGTAWTEAIAGVGTVTYSDTLQYTNDNGETFPTVDLKRPGATVPYAFGPAKTIFDLAVGRAQGDEWVFMANFAGGLVGSRSGGEAWRRIFFSRSDSINFYQTYESTSPPPLAYRSRTFSVAADTTHGDSMYVWAGTAQGVLQYVYAPAADKPNSNATTAMVLCPECVPGESTYVFVGGDRGLTRGSIQGQPYRSMDTGDGLPGPYVTMLDHFAGRLFVGTRESRDGASTGLAYSDDGGETFVAVESFVPYSAEYHVIHDLARMGDRLYVAAERAGLFVSRDTGATWTPLWVDSTRPSEANGWNTVWGLDAHGDTLRVGTDSGMAVLFLDGAGEFAAAATEFYRFAERPNRSVGGAGVGSGTRVVEVKTQEFTDGLGGVDSVAVWTINRPVTDSGSPAIFRGIRMEDPLSPGDTLFMFEPGYEYQPRPYLAGALTHDLAFVRDTVIAAGTAGVRVATGDLAFTNVYHVRDSTTVDEFDEDTVTVLAVAGDTALAGASYGFAITEGLRATLPYGDAKRWLIVRPNVDSLAPDFALNHEPQNSGVSGAFESWNLMGGFIPTLALQERAGHPYVRVWAACQPATGDLETQGISVGEWVESGTPGVYAFQWRPVYASRYFVWNFAFVDTLVFAAADTAGLLMARESDLTVWDTIPLKNDDGVYLVDPGEPVYAVEAIDSFLWVGTGQATVKVRLDGLVAEGAVFYVDSSTAADEVYAFPVPIRQSGGQVAQFRFSVEEPARVTLEIYDAAMNLVRRVIDGREFAPGVYQGRNSGVPTWDGRNGKGDEVAVGVYYFKVEYSTGEVRWGKLAVIP